jgi:excisionase family DNA binding protein
VFLMETRKEQSMQEPLETELLTIPQVAQYLGVCRVYVYKLINDGLPVIRLGRVVRIHMTSLQRWLQDQEQVTDPSSCIQENKTLTALLAQN